MNECTFKPGNESMQFYLICTPFNGLNIQYLIQQTGQSIISHHLSFMKSLLHVLGSKRPPPLKEMLSLYSLAYNHLDDGLLKAKTCRKDNINDK